MLVLSFYETIGNSSVIKDQVFYFFCVCECPIQMSPWRANRKCSLLDFSTGQAFYGYQESLRMLPWMPPESPCLQTPHSSRVNCWQCCRRLLMTPFSTSSSPQGQQYHEVKGSAIREISFLLISQQKCLAAMQPVFGSYLWKARLLLETTKDRSHGQMQIKLYLCLLSEKTTNGKEWD